MEAILRGRGCGLEGLVLSYVAAKPQLEEPYALIGRVQDLWGRRRVTGGPTRHYDYDTRES